MENKTINELSVIELESLGYRQMAQIELSQANLRAINGELEKRRSQPAEEAKPTEESTKKK